MLLDVTFDANGDLDRESFLVKVVNGKQVVAETLPPARQVTPPRNPRVRCDALRRGTTDRRRHGDASWAI